MWFWKSVQILSIKKKKLSILGFLLHLKKKMLILSRSVFIFRLSFRKIVKYILTSLLWILYIYVNNANRNIIELSVGAVSIILTGKIYTSSFINLFHMKISSSRVVYLFVWHRRLERATLKTGFKYLKLNFKWEHYFLVLNDDQNHSIVQTIIKSLPESPASVLPLEFTPRNYIENVVLFLLQK